MRRHTYYKALLACSRGLSRREHQRLGRHVKQCGECQELARSYVTMTHALRHQRYDTPSRTVQADVLTAAFRWRVRHNRRQHRGRQVSLGGGVAVLVLAIASVSPLRGLAADTVDASVQAWFQRHHAAMSLPHDYERSTWGGAGGAPYEVNMHVGAGTGSLWWDDLERNPGPNNSLQLTNVGPSIPHLVIRMDSFGSWTPVGARAHWSLDGARHNAVVRSLPANTVPGSALGERTLGPDNAYLWDFGPLPSGGVEVVTVTLHPTDACCWSLGVLAYANLDRAGRPDPAATIQGGQAENSGGGGPLNK